MDSSAVFHSTWDMVAFWFQVTITAGRLIAFRTPTVCLLREHCQCARSSVSRKVSRDRPQQTVPAHGCLMMSSSSYCYNLRINYYTSIIPATVTPVFAWAGTVSFIWTTYHSVAIWVAVSTYVTDCLVFFKPDSGFALMPIPLADWPSVGLSDNIRHTSKNISR